MHGNFTGNFSGNFTNSSYSNNKTMNCTSTSLQQASMQTVDYISMLILGAVVIIENGLVCLAFATCRKLRKRPSNILVCSQAATDLLVGVAFIPWVIADKFTTKQLHSGYIIFYILFVSLGNLSSLALDRYLALIKPLKHHIMMDVSRTKKILILIWLVPLFLTMVPMSWYAAAPHIQKLALDIYLSIFWVVMLAICIVMVIMYIRIYRTAAKTIRHRQKRIKAGQNPKANKIKTTKKELRVAHMFGLLLFFFILAYLPILYINFVRFIGYSIKSAIYDVSLYSLIVNSLVNPILCLLLKKDYQQIIKRWICFEWLREKLRDDSLQSQAYCRTRISDIDNSDSGSESKRKLFGLGMSRNGRRMSCSTQECKVQFSCREEMVVLMTARQGPINDLNSNSELYQREAKGHSKMGIKSNTSN